MVTFDGSNPNQAQAMREAAAAAAKAWEKRPAAGVPVHGGGMKKVN